MSDDNQEMGDMKHENTIASISVGRDYRTSEHAGMGGAFQISYVENNIDHTNLSNMIDHGLHFQDVEECSKYLRRTFGDKIEIEYVDEVRD